MDATKTRRIGRGLIAIALAGGLAQVAGAPAVGGLRSASRKMASIAEERVAPGTHVVFTAAELAAYAAAQADEIAPGAVREVRVALSPGVGDVAASVDFLKVRQAQSEGGGDTWLMQQLLGGARPVRVRVALQSSGGRARVDVVRVEVSGVPVEGRTLQFLIEHFVRPNFPEAQVSEWFPLAHHLDRVEIRSGTAVAWTRRPGL